MSVFVRLRGFRTPSLRVTYIANLFLHALTLGGTALKSRTRGSQAYATLRKEDVSEVLIGKSLE